MADILVSYTFNSLGDGGAGWSENYYLSGPTTLREALDAAGANPVVIARRGLLHPLYRMQAIRVSDVAKSGDSRIRNLTNGEGVGLYPAPDPIETTEPDTSEEPYDAVLVRMEPGDGLRRRMFKMGGIPVNVIRRNREYFGDQVPAWNSRFQIWRDFMLSTLQVKMRQRGYSDFVNISNFVILADQLAITFTVDNIPPGLTNDKYFQVKGVPAPTNINGIYKARFVVNTAPRTITTYPQRRLKYGPAGGVLQLRTVNYTYPGIATMQPVRGAAKKPGRPFGSLVGSRRRPQK